MIRPIVPSRGALLLCAAFVAGLLFAGCSNSTAPFTQVANGDWSEAASNANMTVTSTGATIQLVCESDAITQPLTVDASGNFSWTGTIQLNGNVVNAGTHPATFSGHATPVQITMTTTVSDGSGFAPQSHTYLRGSRSPALCTA